MSIPSAEQFWQFSEQHYARPGVADVCLQLQDDYGANVNLLLLLVMLEERFNLKADKVFKASGQVLTPPPGLASGQKLDGTPLAGVWAGGDCTDAGEDLTVTAVAQGSDAAEAIHAAIMGAVG